MTCRTSKFLASIVLTGLMFTGLAHARDEWKVIKRGGVEIKGVSIKADDKGELTVQVERGTTATMRVKQGDYIRVITPKHKHISTLEGLYARKDYDNAIKAADQLFDGFKYLGWADDISYIKGMSQLAKTSYADAQKTFELGMRYTPNAEEESKLKRGLIQALLGMKQFDEATKLVESLDTRDPESAAFAYNLKGQLEARNGNNREAVLQYLKVILLHPDAGGITQASYAEVVKLLKEMGDQRYKDFEKEMKEKYP